MPAYGTIRHLYDFIHNKVKNSNALKVPKSFDKVPEAVTLFVPISNFEKLLP